MPCDIVVLTHESPVQSPQKIELRPLRPRDRVQLGPPGPATEKIRPAQLQLSCARSAEDERQTVAFDEAMRLVEERGNLLDLIDDNGPRPALRVERQHPFGEPPRVARELREGRVSRRSNSTTRVDFRISTSAPTGRLRRSSAECRARSVPTQGVPQTRRHVLFYCTADHAHQTRRLRARRLLIAPPASGGSLSDADLMPTKQQLESLKCWIARRPAHRNAARHRPVHRHRRPAANSSCATPNSIGCGISAAVGNRRKKVRTPIPTTALTAQYLDSSPNIVNPFENHWLRSQWRRSAQNLRRMV